MHLEKTPTEFSHVPLPPACPSCWQVMSLTATQPWTLLRGNQLRRYVFECNNCGYTTTRMLQDD